MLLGAIDYKNERYQQFTILPKFWLQLKSQHLFGLKQKLFRSTTVSVLLASSSLLLDLRLDSLLSRTLLLALLLRVVIRFGSTAVSTLQLFLLKVLKPASQVDCHWVDSWSRHLNSIESITESRAIITQRSTVFHTFTSGHSRIEAQVLAKATGWGS